MSTLINEIKKLKSDNLIKEDENFEKLKFALDEYHYLIKSGILTPRKNNIENIYTIYSFHSNINR